MKLGASVLILLISSSALADEFVTMTNGMTCWRNEQGQLWGCSGGVDTGDTGFNDTRTGQRFEHINPRQAIDPRTGQPFWTPQYDNGREDRW